MKRIYSWLRCWSCGKKRPLRIFRFRGRTVVACPRCRRELYEKPVAV